MMNRGRNFVDKLVQGDQFLLVKNYDMAISCYDAVINSVANDALKFKAKKRKIEARRQKIDVALADNKLEKAYEFSKNCEIELCHLELYCKIRAGHLHEAHSYIYKMQDIVTLKHNHFSTEVFSYHQLRTKLEALEFAIVHGNYKEADEICESLYDFNYQGFEFFAYKFECVLELHGVEHATQFACANEKLFQDASFNTDNVNILVALAKYYFSSNSEEMKTKKRELVLKIKKLNEAKPQARIEKLIRNYELQLNSEITYEQLMAKLNREKLWERREMVLQEIEEFFANKNQKDDAAMYAIERASLLCKVCQYEKALYRCCRIDETYGTLVGTMRIRRDCLVATNKLHNARREAENIYHLTSEKIDLNTLHTIDSKISNAAKRNARYNPPPAKAAASLTEENSKIRKIIESCKILRIEPFASLLQVQKAYKLSALAVHPDKQVIADPINNEKFNSIRKARDEIMELKAEYDSLRESYKMKPSEFADV